MESICNYDLCFGCSVCHDICPKQAITIDSSSGFWRPKIAPENCIDCGLCKKTCPANNISDVEFYKKSVLKCYASWSRDENVHFHSASGGLAYEISKWFIENGGCVAGCAFVRTEETLLAKHIIVDNFEDLQNLSKSKYVHSKKDDIYKAVAEEIKKRKVLFIGVSCEVFGLYQYLKSIRRDIANLYTINLLCHGGSSPSASTAHIYGLEKKYKQKITNVTFRGGKYNCQYVAYSGDKIIYKDAQFHDEYFFAFMAHTIYQQVCYKCPFAESRRISDITLADFQGLTKEVEDKCNGKGNSLILVHNQKGQVILDCINERVYLYERPFEEAVKENTTLKEPTETHKEHDHLWYYINKIGFDKAVRKVYRKWYLKYDLHSAVVKFYRRLPLPVREVAKRILKRR